MNPASIGPHMKVLLVDNDCLPGRTGEKLCVRATAAKDRSRHLSIGASYDNQRKLIF